MGESVTETRIIVTHFSKTAICGTTQSTATEEEATNIKALAEMRRVVTETQRHFSKSRDNKTVSKTVNNHAIVETNVPSNLSAKLGGNLFRPGSFDL